MVRRHLYIETAPRPFGDVPWYYRHIDCDYVKKISLIWGLIFIRCSYVGPPFLTVIIIICIWYASLVKMAGEFKHRHQTILHTFSQLFLNLTLSGVPHLYRRLPNGQYLSDLCKMSYLVSNLWKMWTGDHRILTYIFKWERLNTAGHSHTVSIGLWVAPLYND